MKVRNKSTGTTYDAVVYSPISGEPQLIMAGKLVDPRQYEVVQCSPLQVVQHYSPAPKPGSRSHTNTKRSFTSTTTEPDIGSRRIAK